MKQAEQKYQSVPLCALNCVYVQFSWVQFNPLTDRIVAWTWRTIQRRSFSSLFCRKPLWAVLALAGIFTLWCCPSSISSADRGLGAWSYILFVLVVVVFLTCKKKKKIVCLIKPQQAASSDSFHIENRLLTHTLWSSIFKSNAIRSYQLF